jgi:PIN domain nuclease of toxin-antitoxin system
MSSAISSPSFDRGGSRRYAYRALRADCAGTTDRAGAAHFRHVSGVTLWEIAILMTLDRVDRDQRLFDIPDGFDLLPIRTEHCNTLIALPKLHRDPLDRMLIAQARAEDTPLLTRDKAIVAYRGHGARIVSAEG